MRSKIEFFELIIEVKVDLVQSFYPIQSVRPFFLNAPIFRDNI